MAFVELGVNEFGTPVSRHLCDSCGRPFSVCPPVEEDSWGGCCLAEGCASYDLTRDIDLVWDHVDVVCVPAEGGDGDE